MTHANIDNRYERTELLIGSKAIDTLKASKVLVFGVGGVGGFVCEALARAGVGTIHIVDNDTVSGSNINRQIIATVDTIGQDKADVMEKRILSINPECNTRAYKFFYLPESPESKEIDFGYYDYVVDAIDTVSAKIDIIARSKEAGVPIISSMGTGNKLDNTRFRITDISNTSVCPLAKVVRKELRNRMIDNVKVLFSEEEPIKTGTKAPGSISYVPPTAGLIIGGQVIRDLVEDDLI
ncbi:MAG TPA: tRNA threonylcarbamoyladenosine dehydratase [Anaerovoracaceae bacterium]|nr:tRNA threonylcarbamoyladenosine dehydratase [Anaerovoracaceae bacterium]